MSVLSAYEKMLQNPKNRVSSSGMIKQPVPGVNEVSGANMSKVPEQKIDPQTAEENAYMAGVDTRMAARQRQVNENNDSLEKRVKDIEELLVEVMKTQTKLINKLNG